MAMKRSWWVHGSLTVLVLAMAGVLADDVMATVHFSGDNRVRVSVTADQDGTPPNPQLPAEFKQRPSGALPGYENIDFWVQVCCLVNECAPDPVGIKFTKVVSVKASGTWYSDAKTYSQFCDPCVDYHVIVYHNMAATGGNPASNMKIAIDAWCYCCGASPHTVTQDPSFSETVELDPTLTDPDPWDE